MSRCELCGEPMPPGEEMFKFHGYRGPCPQPVGNVGVQANLASELRADAVGHAPRRAARLLAAADEIERLRGLLRIYGRHLDDCGDADAYNRAEVPSCGCGFDVALGETP